MVADTYTTDGVGLFTMGTGNDVGTWGGLLNSQMIQIVADALCNVVANVVTGGTLDLSGSPPPAAPSQVRFARLVFTGTLTSNQTVLVPNLQKTWWVGNFTGGAFSLFIKVVGGGTVQIPGGGIYEQIFCDGATNLFRFRASEIGRIDDFGSTTVPAGYLECDGTSYLRTQYPDLFGVIGTTWGSVDGTHFTVPNLKDTGRFRRSRTGAVAVGTYQANQNVAHTHTGQATGTTDTTGTDHTHTQGGTFTTGTESATHTHSGAFLSLGAAQNAAGIFGSNTNAVQQTGTESAPHTHTVTISGQTGGMSANHTHTFTSGVFTTSSSGGAEARPEAAVVLSCIRY